LILRAQFGFGTKPILEIVTVLAAALQEELVGTRANGALQIYLSVVTLY